MMTERYMQQILDLNKHLIIAFAGLPKGNSRQAAVYTYHNKFTMENGRLTCPDMVCHYRKNRYSKTVTKIPYSRSIKKIIMIRKGDQLLYGKICRKCKAPMPRSHGNCHSCYFEGYEQRYTQTLPYSLIHQEGRPLTYTP
jgi:ribosomal protein L40E